MRIYKSVLSQAIELRHKGFSYNEIAVTLGLSKSTLSNKLRDLELSPLAIQLLQNKKSEGALKGRKIINTQRENSKKNILTKVKQKISPNSLSTDIYRLIASILYWGEGNKTCSHVGFINSDPVMIRTFLKCLRKGFSLDEKKFRILVHIHEYHDKSMVLKYWENVTSIPESQFTKTFIKKNTGKVKHENYMGACRIRYYDVSIAQTLTAIYNTYSSVILGV